MRKKPIFNKNSKIRNFIKKIKKGGKPLKVNNRTIIIK